ncbi:riboflavin kinase [Sporosarcina soli]|uniref:riboflavin kinase n=1 Tax=Sporosarcina soli TaxID=334736 RepID=A0ABW0TPM6_9BACL
MHTILTSFSGKVIPGKQIGQTIGFQTANLQITSGVPKLSHGVYAVMVNWQDHSYVGLMNIGTQPTFKDNSKTSYEIHILDFNKNIYHETLHVKIYFQIRKEGSFTSISGLVKQIHKDIIHVRKALAPLSQQNHNQLPPTKSENKRVKYDINSLIHLPDLSFVQWFDTEFGINRGVFNTIDAWFYQKGVKQITKRRRYILKFILNLDRHNGKKPKVTFGDGGLIPSLTNFWEITTEDKLKQHA